MRNHDSSEDGELGEDWSVVCPGSTSLSVYLPGEAEPTAVVDRPCPVDVLARAVGETAIDAHRSGGLLRRHALTVAQHVRGHHCVVTTPCHATDAERMEWLSRLFDDGGAASLYFLPEPVAVCCAVGEMQGARVLDLGFNSARLAYVARGSVRRYVVSRKLGTAAFTTATNGEDQPKARAAQSRYLTALFPRTAGSTGLPQLFERLLKYSEGTPVVVCGGGAAVAGPALRAQLSAMLRMLEQSSSSSLSSDLSDSGDDEESTSISATSSCCSSAAAAVAPNASRPRRSSAKGSSLRVPAPTSKLLLSPSPEETKRLCALGASLFAAAGAEKFVIRRDQYDEAGPRLVLSRCS